jgi:hypothetical protein
MTDLIVNKISINNNYDIINISKTIQKRQQCTHFIIIFDNLSLLNNTQKYISLCIEFIEYECKTIENSKMTLFVTHPNIKRYDFTKNELYVNFKKIINLTQYKYNNNSLDDIFKQVNEIIELNKDVNINKVLYFSKNRITADIDNSIIHDISIFDRIYEKQINTYNDIALKIESNVTNININHFECYILDSISFLSNTNSIKINDNAYTINNTIDKYHDNLIECLDTYILLAKTHKNELQNILQIMKHIKDKHANTNINKQLEFSFKYTKLKNIIQQSLINNISTINNTTDDIQLNSIYLYTSKTAKNIKVNKTNKLEKLSDMINKNKDIMDKITENKKLIETDGFKKFIEMHENTDDDIFSNSCEYFRSPISLSTWFDELQNCSGIGFMIKIDVPISAKLGYKNNIAIDNITCTYYSITDYIDTLLQYFDKCSNSIYGNLNNTSILNGSIIGNVNAIIPLYINKYHWSIVKNYINILLGIEIAHNPLAFSKNHRLMFNMLFIEMSANVIFNKDTRNNKMMNCYFAYFRTCAEMCFENGYNHGIKNLIQQVLTTESGIVENINMYDSLMTHCIVTGHRLNCSQMSRLIDIMLHEIIRHGLIDSGHDNMFFEHLEKSNDKEQEYDALIKIIFDKIVLHLEHIIAFYILNIELFKFYNEFGSYSKMIKSLDKNFGIFDEPTLELFISNIENDCKIDTFEHFYEIMNRKYDRNEIINIINQNIKYQKINDKKNAITNNEYKYTYTYMPNEKK